jgi:hypothetical protein
MSVHRVLAYRAQWESKRSQGLLCEFYFSQVLFRLWEKRLRNVAMNFWVNDRKRFKMNAFT